MLGWVSVWGLGGQQIGRGVWVGLVVNRDRVVVAGGVVRRVKLGVEVGVGVVEGRGWAGLGSRAWWRLMMGSRG